MCYNSGQEIKLKMFLQEKIFRLTQSTYFYLVVEAQGSLTWLKQYIRLCQKNYVMDLKKLINHVFSFWVQQAYLLSILVEQSILVLE